MSRPPAARLGALHRDEPSIHDIDVDFQPAADSKFEFAWAAPPRAEHPPSLPSEETDSTPTNSQDEAAAPPPPQDESRPSTSSLPRLSRAFSMPLPSQIGHFQHPSRTPGSGSGSGSPPTPTPAVHQFQELSLELADSLQMAIQTLLQLSPPQLFDPAKEQFSSCAVQIPTTSISALLTSMKNLNYMSANIHRFGSPVHGLDSPAEPNDAIPKDDFDVGELLQSVGDSLGGVAAEAEVDLVLHHGDAGIKHIGVKGDECGISYALTHIINQVLATTRHGDSIEIGLSITGEPLPAAEQNIPSDSSSSSRRTSMSSAASESPVLNDEGPVVCTFDIAHRFFTSSVDAPSPNDPNGEPPPEFSDAETRPEPQFDTAILRRLLRHIGGTIRPSLQPRLFSTGRRCELALTLERGLPLSRLHELTPPLEDEMARHPLLNVRLAREPTLEELTTFAETLRGKKVAFHASSQGSFAHHLTRYLTAWGMDISHVPTDGVEETDPAEGATIVNAESVFGGSSTSSPGLGIGLPVGDVVPPIVDVGDPPEEIKPPTSDAGLSFVIIDDDVVALRRRLLRHRAEAIPSLHLHPRKQRPSLAANHRPRSSPSIRNSLLSAHHQPSPPAPFFPVPIVHFTSLAKYKLVKDALQGVLPGPPHLLPEVIVIPKPAGPRRLLTALHTAVHKPVVDPFFSPIATSPMSPSGSAAPFLSSRKSTSTTTPARADPARTSRSPADPPTASSPLAMPDGIEYFSDAAVKKQLGGNAASGLVIQSPDGRPAGIFFQPQSRTSSSKSDIPLAAMERVSGTPPSGTPTPPVRPDKPAPERPRIREPTEVLRSFKGKGRVPAGVKPEQSEARTLSSAAWREATQNLARHALLPTAATIPPPVVVPDVTSPVSRSSSSPPSPEARKTVARRATQGPKSPVASTAMKKSKTMGNNIVPPISVLIVEDNAINQTILSTFMRRNKIKYEVAWNGREAVEKWRHGNFHLILMDIQMPVMDGIEATKEIRRLEKEAAGPFPSSPSARSVESPDSRAASSPSTTPFRSQVIIVALTASSLQSDRVAALAAGCNDFLTKPVTNSWLNDKIIEWGSIKALQMWAELRPEVARNMSQEQAAQAEAVANRLHVPPPAMRKSPLSGPLAAIGEGSREGTASPPDRTLADDKPARRSSQGSSSSGSSPEPWPISSDDEAAQDPITEPRAVIETPELGTVDLPDLDNPQAVSGEAALLNFLEEESRDRSARRPTLLGQRALSTVSNVTSIASVMHDTPGVGGTSTDGLAAAGATARDAPPQAPKGEDKKPGGH